MLAESCDPSSSCSFSFLVSFKLHQVPQALLKMQSLTFHFFSCLSCSSGPDFLSERHLLPHWWTLTMATLWTHLHLAEISWNSRVLKEKDMLNIFPFHLYWLLVLIFPSSSPSQLPELWRCCSGHWTAGPSPPLYFILAYQLCLASHHFTAINTDLVLFSFPRHLFVWVVKF